MLDYVFIKVMNDELFSDLILSRKTRDFDVFGCPTIFFARCYYLPVDSQYSLPVEIVDSIFLPVEVNNSTTELYLPVDSQCSSPVEALNLIVEPKPLPVEVNNSTIALSYICPSRRKKSVQSLGQNLRPLR